MAKARKIILLDGAFQSIKILVKDTILTQFGFTSKFDQLVADAMGIKHSLYDDHGTLLEGLRGWELVWELFGATLGIVPTQKDLFTKNEGLEISSIKLDGAKLRRLRADEAVRLSFTVTVAGIPRDALDYVEGVKKNTIQITIQPANKEREATAQAAALEYGLFKQPKEDGSGEEGEEGNADDDPSDVPPPTEDEPQELSGPALASWREVHGKAKRVPARSAN